MTRMMTFEVYATCDGCQKIDFDEKDRLICGLTKDRKKDTDTCEKWEISKGMVKDTFWIKGIK